MTEERQHLLPDKISVDHIQTRSLSLVDERGKERATFACRASEGGADGYSVLHFNGADGAPRLTFQLNDNDGPTITLFGSSGRVLLSLHVKDDVGNGITVCDASGYPLIQIGVPTSARAAATGSEVGITVRSVDGHSATITARGIENRQAS
jgi:hypothetical protein